MKKIQNYKIIQKKYKIIKIKNFFLKFYKNSFKISEKYKKKFKISEKNTKKNKLEYKKK